MARNPDTTSFTEHSQHLREHFDQVKETGRPLYVTSDGETDAVVLSQHAYDALAEKADLVEGLRSIARGMEDVRDSRTRPARQALEELAEKYGLQLKR